MRKLLSASAALLALAGTATLAAAPAEARWYGGGGYGWHGGYHRGGGAGWAVGAGLLGLAAGAAIASHPYYGPRYGYGYGYYAPPPPPPPAYGYGYYRGCSRWGYWHGYC